MGVFEATTTYHSLGRLSSRGSRKAFIHTHRRHGFRRRGLPRERIALCVAFYRNVVGTFTTVFRSHCQDYVALHGWDPRLIPVLLILRETLANVVNGPSTQIVKKQRQGGTPKSSGDEGQVPGPVELTCLVGCKDYLACSLCNAAFPGIRFCSA